MQTDTFLKLNFSPNCHYAVLINYTLANVHPLDIISPLWLKQITPLLVDHPWLHLGLLIRSNLLFPIMLSTC